MEVTIMIAQLILALTVLVGIHEFGHFAAAKWFGMRVDKFFIFFDPWFEVFSWKRGETKYGIGWLPLGGYVKIAGMVDESMDKKQLRKPPEPWEFRAKPAWQRLIVMIGGVTMNVILGMLVFAFLTFKYGDSYLPADTLNQHGIEARELGQELGFQTGDKLLKINGKPVERFEELQQAAFQKNAVITVMRDTQEVEVVMPDDLMERVTDLGRNWMQHFVQPRFRFRVAQVVKGSNAEKAGLQAGDSILAVNGEPVRLFDQLQTHLRAQKEDTIALDILRNGKPESLQVAVNEDGNIGFRAQQVLKQEREHYGLWMATIKGSARAWETLFANVAAIGMIVSGEISAQHVDGPIGIAKIYGGEWDWRNFWFLTGILSMWLAFINLVPIPALDGGHVMFLLYEMVIRRKPSEKVMEVMQIAGMLFLLALMVLIIGNDILKLFG